MKDAAKKRSENPEAADDMEHNSPPVEMNSFMKAWETPKKKVAPFQKASGLKL